MATALHVGLMQRRASGPAARQVDSRSAQSRWLRDRETPTAHEHLRAQEAIRVPELLPLRYERIAASAWTYFRGAAAAKAVDLATRTHSGILMQMAGDAHVLNFGLWGIRHVLVDFARACGERGQGPCPLG